VIAAATVEDAVADPAVEVADALVGVVTADAEGTAAATVEGDTRALHIRTNMTGKPRLESRLFLLHPLLVPIISERKDS
jgi:hypothetical protein